MLNILIYSMRKTVKLRRFTKTLYANIKPMTTTKDLINFKSDYHWNSFYSFLLNDRFVGSVIKENDLTIDDVRFMSLKLDYMGDSYAGNNFIPLAAFAFRPSLEYLLYNKNSLLNEPWDSENNLKIFYAIKEYLS